MLNEEELEINSSLTLGTTMVPWELLGVTFEHRQN